MRNGLTANLQIRARMSPLPVANSSPCGLGATEITSCESYLRQQNISLISLSNRCLLAFSAWAKRLTRILVALEHELSIPGVRIPELYTPVF